MANFVNLLLLLPRRVCKVLPRFVRLSIVTRSFQNPDARAWRDRHRYHNVCYVEFLFRMELVFRVTNLLAKASQRISLHYSLFLFRMVELKQNGRILFNESVEIVSLRFSLEADFSHCHILIFIVVALASN
jgi:hypothetical protein